MTNLSAFRHAGFALFLVSTGCGPGFEVAESSEAGELEGTSHAIVGGTRDTGHKAVAMMYHSSGYLCSGAFIDKRVFLTAGHCIESLSASGYEVDGGTDAFNDPEWIIRADSVHRHPGFVLDDTGIDHDVGIIVLEEDAPVTPYRWLDLDPDAETYAVGTEFTAVGYGITSGNGSGDGVKRTVDLEMVEIYSNLFFYDASNGGNTCSGDSGGPALKVIDGYTTVIGVVSFGDQNCSQYGADMRTDDNRTFIDDYADPDAGTAKVGGNGGNGSDNPLACSLVSVQSASPLAASLLALVAIGATTLRRRR